MWYNPSKTLTHNALINMVIGPRGCGKTYGLKTYVCKRFKRTHEQFSYVRRNQNELDMVKDTLFSDTPFPVSCKGDLFLLDDEVCGFCMSLTTSHKLKSASFPHVTTIVFDEFIIDHSASNQRYLKNEVDIFLNLLETIIRTRDNVRVFMLANSLSFVNPYTMYWGLRNNGTNICKTPDNLVLCEFFQDTEFVEMKQQTRFGRLNKGSKFEQMSVYNRFVLDSNEFIQHKTGNWRYVCGLILEGYKYALWESNGYFHWDNNIQQGLVYCTRPEDISKNVRFEKRPPFFSTVTKALSLGGCSFESITVKTNILKFLSQYC